MASLFDKAKIVAPKETAKKASKRPEIPIAGMERVAAIDVLIKALEGVKEIEQASVKKLVIDEFIETGCRIKARPVNFRGFEGAGSASCELRARSSRSALTEEEIGILQEIGIPVEKVDTVEECYRINPSYLNDSKLLERVSKAIEKLKDVPADFIQLQAGVSKQIVGEGAIELLFVKAKAVVIQALEIVGLVALKPKFEGGDLEHAFKIVKPLLGNPADDETVVEHQAPPAPVTERKRRAA